MGKHRLSEAGCFLLTEKGELTAGEISNLASLLHLGKFFFLFLRLHFHISAFGKKTVGIVSCFIKINPKSMDVHFVPCLLLMVVTSPVSAMTVVDMTHVLDNTAVFWPGQPSFNITILERGRISDGFWFERNALCTAEHGGTHVDAPVHFYEDSWRADKIPASNLVGPAAVLDVKAKVAINPDYQLSTSDIQDWEKKHGRLSPKSIVMMNSGWSRRYPNKTLVFNTVNYTDPAYFHFPGIHPDAATFLATKRDVIAVGVDTPSTDYGQSKKFETHVVLGQHNVIGIENVANMDSLPARGATVVIGVVKLGGGSGGAARVLGIVGDLGSSIGNNCCIADAFWLMEALMLSYFFVKYTVC